jgi:4-amino-4-deoxy-L-arabinose transferase-like glycosyltransferase
VLLAGAAFLLLTLHQLQLPGLYYDEAWDAVTSMQLLQGAPVELERGAHLSLFGRDWPLMLDDYQGIISAYLLVPFFALGGVNVTALRAFPILSGLIAVVLCFFLARAWFGRNAARLATLLFAVSPSWVFWSRIGVYVVSEIVPFTLGALLAFTAWWRAPRGRNGYLYLGSFLMGLGLATKLLYAWPIVAVLACYLLLHGRALWQARREGPRALRPAWRGPGGVGARASVLRVALTLALGAACFGAGAFTFLAYNWQTHGTYLKIRGSAVQTEYGTNNTTIIPNLWAEVDNFRQLLDGGYFWFQVNRRDVPAPDGATQLSAAVYKDPFAGAAFLLSAVGLLLAAVRALPVGGAIPVNRLRAAGLALLPAALTLAGAFAQPNSRAAWIIAPATLAVALAAGAGIALIRAALLRPTGWARPAGGALLVVTLAAGATWFFTGAPDGRAQGPFDLRLTDLSGVLFWLALFGLLALLGWSAAATPRQRPLVAALGYLAAVLAQSFPTLSGLWATHLLVMLPLPQIVTGAALANVLAAAPRPAGAAARGLPGWRPLAVAGIALALLGGALWTDYRYHRDLTATGGRFAFSDGIYTLARFLDKDPSRPVVAAEWGIRRQLEILSQGQIDPEEIFQYPFTQDPQTLAAFDAALDETLKNPDARYIFTADTIGPALRFPEFERVLTSRGLEAVLEHRSYMRTGEPIYEVYVARRAAR